MPAGRLQKHETNPRLMKYMSQAVSVLTIIPRPGSPAFLALSAEDQESAKMHLSAYQKNYRERWGIDSDAD